MPTKDNSDLLTEKEAAQFLGGIAVGTLRVWRSTKRYPLPFIKIGRVVRYRRQDLEAFLDARTVSLDKPSPRQRRSRRGRRAA